MKRISTFVLFLLLASILASCSYIGISPDTSEAGSISESNMDNTSVFEETKSTEDTVPESSDTTETTSAPEISSVDNIKTETIPVVPETVDINNPKLSDLFDVEQVHKEDDFMFQMSILMSNPYYTRVELSLKWELSFEDVVDAFGKPHGFMPDHPDTLIWISDAGNYYAIRFEADKDDKTSYINAYDQLLHSHSAFYQPVLCNDIDFPEQYSMDKIPITKKAEELIDFDKPWEAEYFDLKHEHLLSDDYLRNINLHYILVEDVFSFLGKPHGILDTKLSSGIINKLFWISESEKIFVIELPYNGRKPAELAMESQKSYVVRHLIIVNSNEYGWVNDYRLVWGA